MISRVLMAITREVTPSIVRCELTHLARASIDVGKARAQHADYERTLAELGCAVQRLPAEEDWADAVFVEDVALVLDEIAILTRPGAESRRAEIPAVEGALRPYRQIARIQAPGTIDGGDVLVTRGQIFVGVSSRTNVAAIDQLRTLTAPLGYCVQPVAVSGCLHLKSAVTAVADDLLLANRSWIPADAFDSFEIIGVHADEPYAANALRVGDEVIHPATFPRTREELERRGLSVRSIDVSELQKAEGAVTCCSLIFES